MNNERPNRLMIMRAGFFSAAAAALALASWPVPMQIPGGPSDTVQHAVAFAVLTVAARLAYPEVKWPIVLAGLAGFGLGIEAVQMIALLHRSPSWEDWLVDCLAVVATLAAMTIWQQVRNWLRRPANREG